MTDNRKDDIPFEDSPPRPAGAGRADKADPADPADNAEKADKAENADKAASADRVSGSVWAQVTDSVDPVGAESADNAESAESAGSAGSADRGDKATESDKTGKTDSSRADRTAETSEERTPPGSGSTGPTGVREDLGTLADEARKLWSALEARVVAPAVQSYPEVARHLGAAGREVAAALRSAVRGSEQSWRTGGPDGDKARQQEKITVERVDRIDPPEQKNRD